MKTALITGASRGIGKELALLHAKAGHNIVAVARSEQELKELCQFIQETYSVTASFIQADLTDMKAVEQVYTQSTSEQDIHYLINNAGFGSYGEFSTQDRTTYASMIQLNILALTKLSHLFIPHMQQHGTTSGILQVASTAGMVPGPYQAVYHASKAYVLSLSQALAKELENSNIQVTALCPGPVDTNFASAANLEDSDIFRQAADATQVASEGFDALMKGKLVKISGLPLYYKLLMGVMPLLPRSIVLEQVAKATKKHNT